MIFKAGPTGGKCYTNMPVKRTHVRNYTSTQWCGKAIYQGIVKKQMTQETKYKIPEWHSEEKWLTAHYLYKNREQHSPNREANGKFKVSKGDGLFVTFNYKMQSSATEAVGVGHLCKPKSRQDGFA